MRIPMLRRLLRACHRPTGVDVRHLATQSIYFVPACTSAILFSLVLWFFRDDRAQYVGILTPVGALRMDRTKERVSFYYSNESSPFSIRSQKGGYTDGNAPRYEFKHKNVHLALAGFEFLYGTYYGSTLTKGFAV